jgi:glycogen synthase
MVYHGRLDKHRGVLALPMLVQKLLNHGVQVQLTLIGQGDAFEALESIAANQKAI